MDQRYARVSTIITTNLKYSGWYEMFGNKPLLDRLRHHCITIRIDGPSLREPSPVTASDAPAKRATPKPDLNRSRTSPREAA